MLCGFNMLFHRTRELNPYPLYFEWVIRSRIKGDLLQKRFAFSVSSYTVLFVYISPKKKRGKKQKPHLLAIYTECV